MALSLPALPGEFRDGWKIIVGCSVGIATGVALLYLSFSIFVVPLTRDLQVSRGDLGVVQALIITAAFGSPLIGWLTDLFASNLVHMGLTIAFVGLVGAGTGSVVLSRPINAHFKERRGTALGIMAVGISVLAIMAPPVINWVLENWEWRGTEIDIFAYFVGRRFELAHYSAIYGMMVGLGWIGNVGGLVGMGKSHDWFGSYGPGQMAAIGCLAISSILLLMVSLPPLKKAQEA